MLLYICGFSINKGGGSKKKNHTLPITSLLLRISYSLGYNRKKKRTYMFGKKYQVPYKWDIFT